MKRRRVTHMKSKPRSNVLSTRRRANKKNTAGNITARNNVFRMKLSDELEEDNHDLSMDY